jgi:glutathione S-transferase
VSSEIIMHCYDASPFTQKALRMLGIKRLAWRWVETPMMPPKDALVALTGGYRGTPVMQVGRHVYIDSQLIARELERRHPAPTLYPGGHAALAHMLVKWSDAMFRNGLTIAIEKTSSAWPEPFLSDRRYLFPDVDFAAASAEGAHARTQFRAHAALLDEQLQAGGAYLLGDAPGLVDVQAHVFIAMARAYYPDVAAELFVGLDKLAAWEQRMQAIGEGRREPMTAEAALAECRASRDPIEGHVTAEFGGTLKAGMPVEVAPDDTRRGGVVGALVHLDRDTVVVRRSHANCGEVAVHFPRLGYRVDAA